MSDINENSLTSRFTVELRKDGILHVRISGTDEVELKTAKEITKEIIIKSEEIKRPTLISSENFAAPTAEARIYMAKEESNPFSSASAYIARSLAEKIMANAYIRLISR